VLVELSVVEQRYRAVLEVLAGSSVTAVAGRFGVSRQAVHRWLGWYADSGLAGLVDRSHRPRSHPAQTSAEVEAAVCELRRAHPRWGARRLEFELGRAGCPGPVPSQSTIYRVLVRHGLVDRTPRGRSRASYRRWERDAPMQLWQLDIVGGVSLVGGGECKVVTGVDDHSRYCVLAVVVVRPTGRAVCAAFAAALAEYGVPDEVLSDNGKQFTARFARPRGGEVLFDRICRENGIVHRLTAVRSPTTTGKVERLHQTLRRELLDEHPLFADLAAAQAAVDAWRAEYNHQRPHQSLEMATPASRFVPAAAGAGSGLELRLPAGLSTVPAAEQATEKTTGTGADGAGLDGQHALDGRHALVGQGGSPLPAPLGLAVQVERVVPPSGNLAVRGQQFWLGPDRAGTPITLWADTTVVHLFLGGQRLKSLPSRLSVDDLRRLLAAGAQPAGPPPIPSFINAGPGLAYRGPIEVERLVNPVGCVGVAHRSVPVGSPLAGRRVTLRLDGTLMQVIDAGVLLRSLPFPLTPTQLARVRGARPAGPTPQPATEPLRVQRRVSCRGAIMIAKQRIHVGIQHAGQTVTVEVDDTTFRVLHGQQTLLTIGRTTRKEVARFKARKPQKPRKIV
jgi:transposase InsO family protein